MKINELTLDLNRLAPVAVYTHTRYDHLVQTLDSLKNNFLAPNSVLYVVSDAPKVDAHKIDVQRIRDYVDDLTGFREIVRIYRNKNLGLKLSLPMAEKAIIGDHGKIINMEDDNISSRNYLDFMNGGLQYFEGDSTIYSISGYCPPIQDSLICDDSDIWFYPWNMSWGYAVWKAKYDKFHPLVNNYPILRKSGKIRAQNRAGGLYVSDSLKRDHDMQKYFPDAVLCTEMFLAGMRTVVPVVSKIRNIGQDGSGQSSGLTTDKYDVVLDNSKKRIFNFNTESAQAQRYRKEATDFYNGGLLTRISRFLGIYHELSSLRARWLNSSKT
ncbi:hypothetical protein LHU53_09365 [Rhodoferax sp. U2-2l]|uniref:hypothetical protein n=1 Tax=Rhodoferax sp. U2-2l TaxID=2884000 RepID=UPI001D0A83D2|nr:hypothetical protein [Rhodoferax sp. U2-2l]MCB8747115.1 hypothetical protein [Rhodoferax sp. U2-2l]